MKNILSSFFSLNHSRRVLRNSYRLYRRKMRILSSTEKELFQTLLTQLQSDIAKKNADQARDSAEKLHDAVSTYLHKNMWDHVRDFVSAVLFALVAAIAIRQMWFELYTIPSGSMRPTLKEEDFLLVSKTDFGINTLGRTSHFYFDPDLVKRGEIFVFSVENMDVNDPDTMYFYVIPGKKQFVKRLIGKPGDTLYFYGGRIYGIDAAGNDLTELRDSDWARPLEHIPFIRFEGKTETLGSPVKGIYSPVVFHQMNEPIAKLTVQNYGAVSGEMLVPMKNYFDIWGMKNFAMARLLTPSQLRQLHHGPANELEKAPLYLEMTHHPTLSGANLTRDEYRRLRPDLATSVSIIPLDDEKLDRIMRHITTCRFKVQDGLAARSDASFSSPAYLPRMKNVENGTYEIQDGKAYRVLWSGITYQLKDDHPLLSRNPEHVQLLYNLGIEMNTYFSPAQPTGLFFPSRYAYFCDQDLYLLGHPIFAKDDPVLQQFLKSESQKRSVTNDYPFVDAGAPLTPDGKIDAAFIRQYGLKIPENMYLALGDNHAMSADSRQFGFVPQDNLRGGASFILWPCGSRWGRLLQPSIAHLTLPNVTVWVFFIMITLGWTIYIRRKYQKPLKLD